MSMRAAIRKKINSTMAVIESVGLASGSIAGGILGYLDVSYSLLLILAFILQILILGLATWFVKEPPREKSPLSPVLQLKEQVRGCIILFCTVFRSLPLS